MLQSPVTRFLLLGACVVVLIAGMRAAAPVIHISAANTVDRWLFTIRDNGVGYEQSSHQSSPVGPVRGIGLSSMRERVASCGGTIDITSVPGKGTMIRANIPVP